MYIHDYRDITLLWDEVQGFLSAIPPPLLSVSKVKKEIQLEIYSYKLMAIFFMY